MSIGLLLAAITIAIHSRRATRRVKRGWTISAGLLALVTLPVLPHELQDFPRTILPRAVSGWILLFGLYYAFSGGAALDRLLSTRIGPNTLLHSLLYSHLTWTKWLFCLFAAGDLILRFALFGIGIPYVSFYAGLLGALVGLLLDLRTIVRSRAAVTTTEAQRGERGAIVTEDPPRNHN